MKNKPFAILIGLLLVAAINTEGTMGQSAGAPDIAVSVALLDENDNPSNSFLLEEQIQVAISLENVGSAAVITSDRFSGNDFYLQLRFYDSNGNIITATHPEGLPDPPPPRVAVVL